jgi:hypothetical protein
MSRRKQNVGEEGRENSIVETSAETSALLSLQSVI